MKKEKSELKLWELEKWTMVAVWENKHIMEFLWVDGIYGRRKPSYWEIVIMGHANQKVSEYGEILWHISDFYIIHRENEKRKTTN